MDTFHHNQNGTLLLHKETGCPLSTMVLASPQNRTPRVTNLKFASQANKCKIILKIETFLKTHKTSGQS